MLHFITDHLIQADPLLIYALVALFLLLESTAVPVVNTTLLLLTGALTTIGHLNIFLLMLVAIAGSICGACIEYQIGKRGGRPILLRVAALFRVDEKKVLMAENWFQRAGIWMVFVSRMTPYIRPFACFPAGISRMDFTRFLLAASSGSMIWCIVIISIGAMLGPHWKRAMHLIENYTIPTICGLIVLTALYSVLSRYLRSRFRAKLLKTESEGIDGNP